MIENLHPHAPTATGDKHLRPSDIPKTLYLPGAELLFFNYTDRTSLDPGIAAWCHTPTSAQGEVQSASVSEREPL